MAPSLGCWVWLDEPNFQMRFEVQRMIGADHPSLPGHFPGTPIIPGVVILDEVFAALTEWRRDSRVIVISAVKFLAPLNPDRSFIVSLAARDDTQDQVDFRCHVEERVIVEGRLHVGYGSN
jgi:3-hydroxymyristoyl/3-hydroxydecanoyl-(acyl carrier protein) dehydratase